MIKWLVSYVVILINISTNMFLYKIFTNEKIKFEKNNIFKIMLICLLLLLTRFFNRIDINILTNIVFIVFLLKNLYNITIKKSIYYGIIISIISLFSDALVSMFISNSLISNYKIYQTNYYLRSLITIPLSIVEIVITFFPFLKIIINKFYDKFVEKKHFNRISYTFFGLTVIVIMTFFCLNAYDSSTKIGHILIIFSIFSFTILYTITLALMYQEFQIKQVNKQIINENKYIKEIAKKEAVFKHNVINNLLGIKTISNKKTSLLIDELICEYKSDYKIIANINDLPNGIQSIIYMKAYQRDIPNLNLIVDNNISNDLYDLLSAKKYNNFITSIGILFDNALEAIENTDDKLIMIDFNEDDDYIYFSIKNIFNNIVDVEEIGKINYTSKKSGHGIGINYIVNLKTLEIKNEIINNYYITKIRVKKITK